MDIRPKLEVTAWGLCFWVQMFLIEETLEMRAKKICVRVFSFRNPFGMHPQAIGMLILACSHISSAVSLDEPKNS